MFGLIRKWKAIFKRLDKMEEKLDELRYHKVPQLNEKLHLCIISKEERDKSLANSIKDLQANLEKLKDRVYEHYNEHREMPRFHFAYRAPCQDDCDFRSPTVWFDFDMNQIWLLEYTQGLGSDWRLFI